MATCGTCKFYPNPKWEEDSCWFHPPRLFVLRVDDEGRELTEERRPEVYCDDMACGQYQERT